VILFCKNGKPDSSVRNNPNDWGENPRYILDLVKVGSIEIVKALPDLNESKNIGSN
jgi:predicted helicase